MKFVLEFLGNSTSPENEKTSFRVLFWFWTTSITIFWKFWSYDFLEIKTLTKESIWIKSEISHFKVRNIVSSRKISKFSKNFKNYSGRSNLILGFRIKSRLNTVVYRWLWLRRHLETLLELFLTLLRNPKCFIIWFSNRLS